MPTYFTNRRQLHTVSTCVTQKSNVSTDKHKVEILETYRIAKPRVIPAAGILEHNKAKTSRDQQNPKPAVRRAAAAVGWMAVDPLDGRKNVSSSSSLQAKRSSKDSGGSSNSFALERQQSPSRDRATSVQWHLNLNLHYTGNHHIPRCAYKLVLGPRLYLLLRFLHCLAGFSFPTP